jgi:hypothetical protein
MLWECGLSRAEDGVCVRVFLDPAVRFFWTLLWGFLDPAVRFFWVPQNTRSFSLDGWILASQERFCLMWLFPFCSTRYRCRCNQKTRFNHRIGNMYMRNIIVITWICPFCTRRVYGLNRDLGVCLMFNRPAGWGLFQPVGSCCHDIDTSATIKWWIWQHEIAAMSWLLWWLCNMFVAAFRRL